MKAAIVLGLGYGDEGKGKTVDTLCHYSHNPVVVRFSGGQQAGHTVMWKGKKHVHSNFGAGTLRGVPSYFSEHCTVYPTTILREWRVLYELDVKPKLTIHPKAMITTPLDVFANRQCKTDESNGTCGLGVGKTMKRQESPYKLYAIDLLFPKMVREKIKRIADYYFVDYTKMMKEDRIFAQHMLDFFLAVDELEWDINDYTYLETFSDVIFEGSQGILLDMDYGVFPHVTYSNTTSKNAIDICNKLGLKKVEKFYVSRTYSTRHGNGPYKEAELNLINTEEETNVLNIYQGKFKYSWLDYDLLNYALTVDRQFRLEDTISNFVLTCVDQLPIFKFNKKRIKVEIEQYFYTDTPETKSFLRL